jgi:hypothetical protein
MLLLNYHKIIIKNKGSLKKLIVCRTKTFFQITILNCSLINRVCVRGESWLTLNIANFWFALKGQLQQHSFIAHNLVLKIYTVSMLTSYLREGCLQA